MEKLPSGPYHHCADGRIRINSYARGVPAEVIVCVVLEIPPKSTLWVSHTSCKRCKAAFSTSVNASSEPSKIIVDTFGT